MFGKTWNDIATCHSRKAVDRKKLKTRLTKVSWLSNNSYFLLLLIRRTYLKFNEFERSCASLMNLTMFCVTLKCSLLIIFGEHVSITLYMRMCVCLCVYSNIGRVNWLWRSNKYENLTIQKQATIEKLYLVVATPSNWVKWIPTEFHSLPLSTISSTFMSCFSRWIPSPLVARPHAKPIVRASQIIGYILFELYTRIAGNAISRLNSLRENVIRSAAGSCCISRILAPSHRPLVVLLFLRRDLRVKHRCVVTRIRPLYRATRPFSFHHQIRK